MVLTEEQSQYYSNLEGDIETNKLQGQYRDYKKVGAKRMEFVKNGQNRRNTFAHRAATMVQRVNIVLLFFLIQSFSENKK